METIYSNPFPCLQLSQHVKRNATEHLPQPAAPLCKSSLRPIPRESVFPEDLIGSKSTFKTYSLVEYDLKKTYFNGLEKIGLKLDLF